MPSLDVSEVLDDPLFQDVFDWTVTTITQGTNGRPVKTPVTYPGTVGVVQMDRGRNRDLIAEGAALVGSIEIHSRSRLSAGNATKLADTIVWDGNPYIVTHVDNYSRYGSGYICAYADLMPLGGGSNG